MENKQIVFLPDDEYKALEEVGKMFDGADAEKSVAILINFFVDMLDVVKNDVFDVNDVLDGKKKTAESKTDETDLCISEKYRKWFAWSCTLRDVTPDEMFKEMIFSLVYAHDEKMEEFTEWKEKDEALNKAME